MFLGCWEGEIFAVLRLPESHRLQKRCASVATHCVLQSLTCSVAARVRDIRTFATVSRLKGLGAARLRDIRNFRLFLAHDVRIH